MTTTQAPSSRLRIPKQFGRRPDAAFLPSTTVEEEVLTEAAKIQHYAAVAVLDELAQRDLQISWLATELDENADHLRRKLHGQVSASLRDLCAWGVALGLSTVSRAPSNATQARVLQRYLSLGLSNISRATSNANVSEVIS